MAFDVPTTRGAYTSLSDGWTYLNAGKRAQVPERVLSAMNSAFRAAPKSLPGEAGVGAHGQSRSSGVPAAVEMTTSARRAFADLTGGPVAGVVLGASREVLMQQFTAAMSRRLSLGANLVISRIGSQVVHAPLRRAADLYGARVRIAEADLATGALPAWQFDNLVDAETRLVVVPAADPFVGTIAPVKEIVRRVHANSSAWVLVDASDVAAYRDVSMTKLGADIMLVDASVWGGPEVSALVFKDPAMFARMTSLSYAPNARGADRIEVSPVSPALLGGVSESVQHLASLDRVARGSRRHRIETAMPQAFRYLTTLSERLISALMTLPRVYIIGMDAEDDSYASVSRTQHIPRVSFLVDGVPAATVVGRLLDNGLVTSVVDAFESPLLEAMGIDEAGGAVGVGLQPFNTPHDIDQLVRAVASLG
ncbi:MAG: aminotransferase class V-fold PLP-dependent enzyme [Corynebacterium sp.]|nr:aminotransferase class V-fold PLP-dependent enzyme [Corynebacterium sp.]